MVALVWPVIIAVASLLVVRLGTTAFVLTGLERDTSKVSAAAKGSDEGVSAVKTSGPDSLRDGPKVYERTPRQNHSGTATQGGFDSI